MPAFIVFLRCFEVTYTNGNKVHGTDGCEG